MKKELVFNIQLMNRTWRMGATDYLIIPYQGLHQSLPQLALNGCRSVTLHEIRSLKTNFLILILSLAMFMRLLMAY